MFWSVWTHLDTVPHIPTHAKPRTASEDSVKLLAEDPLDFWVGSFPAKCGLAKRGLFGSLLEGVKKKKKKQMWV